MREGMMVRQRREVHLLLCREIGRTTDYSGVSENVVCLMYVDDYLFFEIPLPSTGIHALQFKISTTIISYTYEQHRMTLKQYGMAGSTVPKGRLDG